MGQQYKKCTMYAYTFTFLMAVPGQNMHNGNEVYDMIHYKNKKFIKNVNKCTGAGFYIPPKISLGNTFHPTKPSFETFNVSSIELTYVAPPLTPAPTPAATKKGNDCKVSKWSKHTQCSSSCGGGKQSAWRVIISPNAGNGKACPKLSNSSARLFPAPWTANSATGVPSLAATKHAALARCGVAAPLSTLSTTAASPVLS